MTYPTQGETILTDSEARLMRRLLALFTTDQLTQLACEYEYLLSRSEWGSLTLVVRDGQLRYIQPSPSLELRD